MTIFFSDLYRTEDVDVRSIEYDSPTTAN